MASALIAAVNVIVNLLYLLIAARVACSWIQPSRGNKFVGAVYALTEPLIAPVRQILRKSPINDGMPLDLSPLVLFLLVALVKNIILGLIV